MEVKLRTKIYSHLVVQICDGAENFTELLNAYIFQGLCVNFEEVPT